MSQAAGNPPNTGPATGEEAGKDGGAGSQRAPARDFPADPDAWTPPEGVTEELKAKEGSGGKNRQWKDRSGRIVRRFDRGERGKRGWNGVDHWHDETGRHILPNR